MKRSYSIKIFLKNHLLKPGDQIVVYSKKVFNLNYNVTVLGEVNAPGSIEFKPGMNLKDAILAAKGVAKNVFRYKSRNCPC